MQPAGVTMEDSKSYTVRTETGEIHLMSQEEVSTLVRATMARARSNSRNHHKLSRDTNVSSASGDLGRRFSFASRYSAGKGKRGANSSDPTPPEEVSTSTTKIPLEASTVGASMEPASVDRKLSRRLNTRRFSKDSTHRIGKTEEHFSSLVKTVGPNAMDRDFDPETVSFTVSTEKDGQKHLSENELNDLVRNSIARARNKAQLKGSTRRSAENKKSRFVTAILSEDSLSPRKSLNRKFSWSTVEKSDEEFDDVRDDETAERCDGNERCEVEPLILRPGEVEIVSKQEGKPNEDAEANAHYQTSEVEEVFTTPCTSPKKASALSPRPTSSDYRSIRGFETPSLSLVLSTGGDSVLSDRVIYQMVKQSMDKAKQTRREITDLLEDTPSGVSKVDVADIVEGTMRRARETARSLEIPSLSPQKQRPDPEESTPATTPAADLPEEKESAPIVPETEVIVGRSLSIDQTLNVADDVVADLAPELPVDEAVALPMSAEVDVSSTSLVPSDAIGQSEVEDKILTDINQSPLSAHESETFAEEQIVVNRYAPGETNPTKTEILSPTIVETAVTVHRASCFDNICCCVLALNPTVTQEEMGEVTEGQGANENPAVSADGEVLVKTADDTTSPSILPRDTDEDLEAVSSLHETTSSNADGLMLMLNEESTNVVNADDMSKPNEETQAGSILSKEQVEKSEQENLEIEDNVLEVQTAEEATNESIEVSRTKTLDDIRVEEASVSNAMLEEKESRIESQQNQHAKISLSEDAQDSMKSGNDPCMSPTPARDTIVEVCEQELGMDSSKARRKLRRQQNKSKYRRQRQGEIESVITDEFLAEVNSMRGLKITPSELAKIFESSKVTVSPTEENHHSRESRVHYASADESIVSNQQSEYESLANADENKSSIQSPAFCADFLSIFSDPFDADDDFGSVSLYNNESATETLSKKDSQRDPTPKSAEYESELANSYNGRRLTFSFSEGRYTVSMSLSDEY